jgi:hypothetical protein
MRRRVLLIVGIIVGGFAIGFSAAQVQRDADDGQRVTSDGSTISNESVHELVNSSGAIVVGHFLSERKVNTTTGRAVRADVIRTFSVDRVLKGTLTSDRVDVWATLAYDEPAIEDLPPIAFRWTTPSLSTKPTYVLFLSFTPHESGNAEWILVGEPSIAELRGDSLEFVVSRDFSDERSERGMPPGKSGAGPAFDDVTLAAVLARLR